MQLSEKYRKYRDIENSYFNIPSPALVAPLVKSFDIEKSRRTKVKSSE